tara:strand:- start:1 stop:204 length:204 start_codon:yes stop_codon:yes gene_type:complete
MNWSLNDLGSHISSCIDRYQPAVRDIYKYELVAPQSTSDTSSKSDENDVPANQASSKMCVICCGSGE